MNQKDGRVTRAVPPEIKPVDPRVEGTSIVRSYDPSRLEFELEEIAGVLAEKRNGGKNGFSVFSLLQVLGF